LGPGRLAAVRTSARTSARTATRTALAAARAAFSAGAALTRTRGASLFEDLLLLGRQDLAEFGLGLFLKFGNLFLLICRKVHLLDRKTRDQMEPARGTAGAARATTARTTARRTTRTARGGTVLCGRLQGKGGNRDEA